jgi:hypothetical protein
VLLAALWLWAGIAYHKVWLHSITTAGEIFGSIFIAEAGLLLLSAWQNASTFERPSRSSVVAGTIILAYALVGYPALGILLGHHYPAAATFGTPCPTTLFTFGVFCLLPASIPRFAAAIPVLWAIIGSYAAFGFGVREDIGLLAAALATLLVMHHETHRSSVAPLPV